eukprot:gnl/Dysnectes_brevis/350_a386_2552.p1 GENE.gnl/Dysnectes_brevis/350_a386_2552~~gnl/Dysnectes_brevis/350_a386_2552.p1  ORF type:complete len:311 (-),score=74.46 gnl/Dysnectes_brevis/350_a386_2552:74-1006(-)
MSEEDHQIVEATAEVVVPLSEQGLHLANQKKIWNKLIEMRIAIQKGIVALNTLPAPESMADFAQESELEEQITMLIEKSKRLRSILLSNISIILSRSQTIELPESVPSSLPLIREHAYTKLSTSPSNWQGTAQGFSVIDQSIGDQIEFMMREFPRLRERTQRNSEGLAPLGRVDEEERDEKLLDAQPALRDEFTVVERVGADGTAKRTRPVPAYSAAMFVDTQFYSDLLMQLISAGEADPLETMRRLQAAKARRRKMRKRYDKGAAKSRKVRVGKVHKSLVGFGIPVPTREETLGHALRGRLFGGRSAEE